MMRDVGNRGFPDTEAEEARREKEAEADDKGVARAARACGAAEGAPPALIKAFSVATAEAEAISWMLAACAAASAEGRCCPVGASVFLAVGLAC